MLTKIILFLTLVVGVIIMKINMGLMDRGMRVGLAILLMILYFTGTLGGILGTIGLGLGGILLCTSAIGFCPLYLPLGFSTKKEQV